MTLSHWLQRADDVVLVGLFFVFAVAVVLVLAGYVWTIARSCWVLGRVYFFKRRS